MINTILHVYSPCVVGLPIQAFVLQMTDQQSEEGFTIVDGCPTFIHQYGTLTESTKVVILIVPGTRFKAFFSSSITTFYLHLE